MTDLYAVGRKLDRINETLLRIAEALEGIENDSQKITPEFLDWELRILQKITGKPTEADLVHRVPNPAPSMEKYLD